jgi:hypothetical protein
LRYKNSSREKGGQTAEFSREIRLKAAREGVAAADEGEMPRKRTLWRKMSQSGVFIDINTAIYVRRGGVSPTLREVMAINRTKADRRIDQVTPLNRETNKISIQDF